MRKQKIKTVNLKVPQELWQMAFDLSMEISPDKTKLISPINIFRISINHLYETAVYRGIKFVSKEELDKEKKLLKEKANKHVN
mgnify:CR=1 FL=1|tara:strand:- start:252 stop:500 length:249 start_codon:yes stop_codon:yes gene_type:complete